MWRLPSTILLVGYPLLLKITRLLRIDASRIGYAHRYFERHGDATVFFGRYFSVMRAYVAFLASVNRMPWQRFLFWNAPAVSAGRSSMACWGVLAYVLGHNVALLVKVLRMFGIGGIVAIVAFAAIVLAFILIQRCNRRQQQHTEITAQQVDENARADPDQEIYNEREGCWPPAHHRL